MDDNLAERLTAIEARLDAVERRAPDRLSMKEAKRCPSCGCAKLLESAFLRADIVAATPFALSMIVQASGRVRTQGVFQVHACTKCGLVEWHALELAPSILDDPKLALIESPDDTDGPYR
jgi:hypothetical protein